MTPLALASLLLFCAPTRAADVPYLKYVDDNTVKALANQNGLYRWREDDFNSAEAFRYVKSSLVAQVERGLAADNLLPQGTTLPRLPEPRLNRMVLTALRKKAGLFKTQGEELAFMASVIQHEQSVKWMMLGGDGDNDFGAAKQSPPAKDPPYAMNCAQFIQYVAYRAGYPEDAQTQVPQSDWASRDSKVGGLSAQLVQTYFLDKWQGWWKPAYDKQNGAYSYQATTIMPGDLIVLFLQNKTGGSPEAYQFFHVEMVTQADPENLNGTRSIGNSGKAPHYSNLLGKWDRFWQWADENYPLYLTKEKTNDWRYVIYRLRQPADLPETLKLD